MNFFIETSGCVLTFPRFDKWHLTLVYLLEQNYSIQAIGWN
jgi:hypothetical protein